MQTLQLRRNTSTVCVGTLTVLSSASLVSSTCDGRSCSVVQYYCCRCGRIDLHLFCWQCENKFNDDDDVMKCVVCELYSSVVHVMNAVV